MTHDYDRTAAAAKLPSQTAAMAGRALGGIEHQVGEAADKAQAALDLATMLNRGWAFAVKFLDEVGKDKDYQRRAQELRKRVVTLQNEIRSPKGFSTILRAPDQLSLLVEDVHRFARDLETDERTKAEWDYHNKTVQDRRNR